MELRRANNVRLRVDSDSIEVLISSKYLKECIEFINKHNITSIDVMDLYYKGEDLNFLKECPNVEDISVDSFLLKDISGLFHLNNIKVLALGESTVVDAKIGVDIAAFPNIEKLYLHWGKKIKGLQELTNLKELSVWKYAPKQGNLEELTPLRNLETLSITQSKITSIKGLENLKNLKTLGLFYLRSLKDLTALNEVHIPLKELNFENCKGIDDFSPVERFKELEKLEIRSCGDIHTLSFITKLNRLKSLSFPETNILDGDLDVCSGIEDVYYTKQKLRTKLDISVYDKDQLNKPTIDWEKRMSEGDDTFTVENINAAGEILDSFLGCLEGINGKPIKSKITQCVKQVVLKLNKLNETNEYFIETLEREELSEFINEAVRLKGYAFDEDITEEWREW